MKTGNIILSALLTAGLCGCAASDTQQPAETEAPADSSEPAAENIEIKMDPVFHSTTAQIDVSELEALGFELGDSISLSFSDGTVFDDVPYHNGYYVKPGGLVAVVYPGLYGLNIAYNLSEGTWDALGFKEGDTVTIRLNEKGKYLNEQITFAQAHSDTLSDYDSPEQFANFRSLSGGDVKADRCFRAASMTNNTMKRADVVDDLAETYGIRRVMDMSDTEEALAGLRNADTWNSDYFDRLDAEGNVQVLGLGVNPASQEFHTDLSQGLYDMIQGEGPYLFFCTEGKDRTGYAAALIEALCGADYAQLRADYMKTYENYYGMTEESAPEQCAAVIGTYFDPILEIMFELQDGETLQSLDYEERARVFLKKGGLSDEQIDELRSAFAE